MWCFETGAARDGGAGKTGGAADTGININLEFIAVIFGS